jgi:hypothetical protein
MSHEAQPRVLTATGMAWNEPCVVCCLHLNADGPNGSALLYNGDPGDIGEFVGTFKADQKVTLAYELPDGVLFGQGVYVEFVGDLTEAVVYFRDPLPE